VRRREFVTLIGGAALWPWAALASEPGKLPTIGFLGPTTPTVWSSFVGAFLQRMRELGWIDGHNIAIQYRWAEGREDRYIEFAADLVRLKVDIILTGGTAAVIASNARRRRFRSCLRPPATR
jgi:putative ABC transport system substrate-binding protein